MSLLGAPEEEKKTCVRQSTSRLPHTLDTDVLLVQRAWSSRSRRSSARSSERSRSRRARRSRCTSPAPPRRISSTRASSTQWSAPRRYPYCSGYCTRMSRVRFVRRTSMSMSMSCLTSLSSHIDTARARRTSCAPQTSTASGSTSAPPPTSTPSRRSTPSTYRLASPSESRITSNPLLCSLFSPSAITRSSLSVTCLSSTALICFIRIFLIATNPFNN